ncbi:MAG: S8 family serine peptidase [Candidatus Limnocylindria bacterium]
MRRILAILSAAVLLMTAVLPAGAVNRPRSDTQDRSTAVGQEDELRAVEASPASAATARLKDAEAGIFIVRFAEEPLASYEGGTAGLARTKPNAARGEQLNVESAPARAYLSHLGDERAEAMARIEEAIGRQVEVDYVYDVIINGFAAYFMPEEAITVAGLRGVANVEPDEIHELHTDNGPGWIGAPSIWSGDATGVATQGEGVIVGVIDTGINPSNPSFADIGPVDGFDHTNPKGAFVGVCDPAEPAFDPTFPCNDKLIGAWDTILPQDSPDNDARDTVGHGSHTASTAAGNVVDATVFAPATPGLSITRQISGVAPHANIIAYRACCTSSGLNGGIQQAVIDEVDVINFSIGGGSTNPWADSVAIGFLNAREAGVFVATSAGNDGPGAGTAGSPGDAPWILTVAATTHDRNISNTLTGFTGGASALADIVGKGFTGPFGPAPIVLAADFGDNLCLEPFPAGTFSGQIVLCDRGIAGRVEKGANVLAGGAGGYILANDEASASTLNSDPHVLPGVHISFADAEVLKAWLATATDPMVSISGVDGVDEDPSFADIMASFSSRGPNPQMDVIIPSVGAPGLDIIAAHGQGDPSPPVWDIVSGTSMASPHAAGSAALLTALHPDWTPDEIQAALMTTAASGVVQEDGVTPATPFDVGAGRIDLASAANAGLVLDETTANYLAADPTTGGDPKTLNLPNLADSQCLGTCSWTRTVTATTDASWTASTTGGPGLAISVTPSAFSLTAGQTQELTITADVAGATIGEWMFGEVAFTSTTAPRAHFPMAVMASAGVLPDEVEINTRRDAGSQLVSGFEVKASPELTVDVHGLVEGTIHDSELNQDSNRDDPYDTLGEVFWTTVEASSSARLVAEVLASEAPDADLFVGTGPTPSLATEVCASHSPTSAELCDITDPADGTWWVLLQNWDGSDAQPDATSLAIAVVPFADQGNMTVDAPASVGQREPFDVRVFWDEEDLEAGDHWYGAFGLGSTSSTPGDIGRVAVNLIRHDDDVTKTADVATADPGNTVTYTITVAPNVTPEDLAYTITDTVPEGLTYVDGSATGGATVTDGVLSWTGTMPTSVGAQGDYLLTTNATDPSCAVPFADGTWVDFDAFGLGPIPGFDGGDFTSAPLFTSGAQFRYYDQMYTGLIAAPVGTGMFDTGDFGQWWIPQAIPDPTAPNAVVAGLWGDFEWVEDQAAGTGFRAIVLSPPGPPPPDSWAVLDHEGLQRYGGSADSWSVQQWIRRTPASSGPSIVYAYHGLGSLELPLTIGVEDHAGVAATSLVNNGPATGTITDDTLVCFTYEGPSFDPHVITYQVTVDSPSLGATLTNEAVHDTDNPGSQPAVASVDLEVIENLDAISVEPSSVKLKLKAGDDTQQFTATAEFSDGATMDVTDVATWSSDDEEIVVIDAAGFATAVGGGRTSIMASLFDVTDDARVHVTGRPSNAGPPPHAGRPT